MARAILGEFTLIDVREVDELPEIEQPHIRLPMSKFDAGKLPTPAVLVCESGARSYQLAARMHALGKVDVLSLTGGIGSLSDDRIQAREG